MIGPDSLTSPRQVAPTFGLLAEYRARLQPLPDPAKLQIQLLGNSLRRSYLSARVDSRALTRADPAIVYEYGLNDGSAMTLDEVEQRLDEAADMLRRNSPEGTQVFTSVMGGGVDRSEPQADTVSEWITNNSLDVTIGGTTFSFYRQPGGCVEASDQSGPEGDVDILHFHGDEEAEEFLTQFSAFIRATAKNVQS